MSYTNQYRKRDAAASDPLSLRVPPSPRLVAQVFDGTLSDIGYRPIIACMASVGAASISAKKAWKRVNKKS